MASYIWRICRSYTPPTSFDIKRTVDRAHVESMVSPIDQFIVKSKELHVLLLDPNNIGKHIDFLHGRKKLSDRAFGELKGIITDTSLISPVLANLVLLGHISAVESYFRAIFRRLVLVDLETQRVCHEKEVTYGAVLVHEAASLPDALMELISFSSKKNIEDALREFFGVKGGLPQGLLTSLDEFNKICQLRHSIIHKFGVLGSNNVKHDLVRHRDDVNKPIKNDFQSIQDVSLICANVVFELNQLIWQTSMMRLISDFQSNRWKKKLATQFVWRWGKDKPLFKKYFDIFFSNEAMPPNPNIKEAYMDLENTYKSLV